MKRLTTEEFIDKAKLVHNNTYDYSLVNYINSHSKIKLICSVHGEFEQKPNNHLNGAGCQKCYHTNKNIGNDEFIKKAKQIHGDKYNYSITEYIESKGKVKILCPIHGIFEQKASGHLSGKGCFGCFNNNKLSNATEFINKSVLVHGDRYKYNNVIYVNNKTKVNIICPTHGLFSQRPSDHMTGNGCPSCNESKGEREIRKYLVDNNIKFISQHTFNDCVGKDKKLPFDFYLPNHNTCIEFNGIQHYELVKHFGGEKKLIRQQKTDKIKKEYCLKNNIPLIIIKYDEKIEESLFIGITMIT